MITSDIIKIPNTENITRLKRSLLPSFAFSIMFSFIFSPFFLAILIYFSFNIKALPLLDEIFHKKGVDATEKKDLT